MKDGEKRAKKTAKTVKKASREKSSPKQAVGKKGGAPKISAKVSAKTAAKGPPKSDGRGKADLSKARKGPVVVSFANPAVGNAFKRAVKKYSNALKRLTD